MKNKSKTKQNKKTFRKINIFHIVLEQPFFPKVNFFSNSM